MKDYTRRAVTLLLAFSLTGTLTACNMSTNEDAEKAMQEASEKADEDFSYADMSEEDFAEKAAKTVEDFFNAVFDTSLVDTIDKLPDEEKRLLKRVNSVESFNDLSDEEKDTAIEAADKVYGFRDRVAGADDMSKEDTGALIVGINTTLDVLWRFTDGQGAMTAKPDPKKAEVDSGRTKVTFPVGSVSIRLAMLPGNQEEPITVRVDGGQLRVDGQFLIEVGKEGGGGTMTRTRTENGVTTTEEEQVTLFEK
ncbi:hypothetical protein ACN4DJ_09665 [Corynebacterium macclintockiae]|uniref:hypothetical protein n=2 Tax=Corynebacterium macclintockiae TaxID=2913501 RepID=UPI003EBE11E6